ncbi:hypothetical protein DFQ01_12748 [Paenibacillus cellulosilyticus]|uniref:Uncharacterized protein n=1 Tax=Paenibacillus cellulosilyticus TaxID=375489 RepID=A0A2V2YM87_9BACL|nr:hypothetical protein [Paenibacillus cellulosilyticus]PWV95444.1 hypothetical protein DFQ01_12748 [Paenibacillus cellulosilyticus]QKS43181.1 hypothetical protein HUB94_01500 [Paenibacillus cellulosilyticus]
MTELIRARFEVVKITLIGDPLAAAYRLVPKVNTMEGQVWSSVINKA